MGVEIAPEVALRRPDADEPASLRAPLVDRFGRTIDYLRVSVTDRCNLRCVYCMGEDVTFVPREEVLSLEELGRMCSAFVGLGVRRIRFTGGEPLARRNVMSLIEAVSRHLATGMLDEITLTTNGTLLARYATALRAAGVRRVNVSLDTLDPARFAEITRCGKLSRVLEGVDAALDAGLAVKLNAVASRDMGAGQVEDLMRFAHARGMDLTLIEMMPLGAIGGCVDSYLPLTEVRARIAARFTLVDVPERTAGPAEYVRVAETGGRLGFIRAVSHRFCGSCNRVRVTCTGQLALCLGHDETVDLRGPMRASPCDDLLMRTIADAIARKPAGHAFSIRPKAPPSVRRTMNTTGG
jgi:GTP 3',8-cyclase